MTLLATNSSVTLAVGDSGSVVISTNGGMASVTATALSGAAITSTLGPAPVRQVFGPYSEGGTVTIANQSAYLDYDFQNPGSTLTLGQARATAAIVNTPQAKLAALSPKPIGFNYYSLIYEILIGAANISTNRPLQLAYIAATGANMVRVALPVFSAGEYLTLVHSTATMPATMQDGNLRASYILALDTAFAAAASAGLKLHVTDEWGPAILPTALGETITTAFTSTTTKTAIYAASAAQWLFNRYSQHPAFGVYSIQNETPTDGTGVTAPTPAQLGAYFTFVAAAAKAVDPSKIITSDMTPPGIVSTKAKVLPDTTATAFGTIFAGLDAWCVHFYSDNYNFVGRCTADNATFPNTNGTTLGYEGIVSLVESYRAMATAQGKLLIAGEFGVSTAHEADSSRIKKDRMQRAIASLCDYGMWWNVQDSALAGSSGQSTWFITPSTTRGDTFSAIVTEANAARPTVMRKAGGTKSLRAQLRPTTVMTTTRTAAAVLSVTSGAAQGTTNYALAFWFRANATLNAFEAVVDCRGAGQLSGFVALGEAVAATGMYCEFRGASGNAGNSAGEQPDLVLNEWNHYCFSWEALNATTAVSIWINGLFWKTKTTVSTLAAIPAATSLKFLGSASGAPCSMQDIAFMQSVSSEDVWAHMRGDVLKTALMHIRGLPNGQIVDLGPSALSVGVGAGVSVVNE